MGILGVIPIAIGLSRLLNREENETEGLPEPHTPNAFAGFCSPQTYSVAAITFANGGDNIGIYVPLFASNSLEELLVILGTFFSLVGVWCYSAYRLSQLPLVAANLSRYGNICVPYILMGLGGVILIEGHTLEDRGLTVITLALCCFCLLSLNRSSGPAEAVEIDE
jgi:cadmium resistance protein CadD (predicted permease)